jgi:ATP-dependent Clp protease adapter protein ClpS
MHHSNQKKLPPVKAVPLMPNLLPHGHKLLTAEPKLLPVPYVDPEQANELTGEGYRVLLYNDEVHSMDEVALQLVKALSCTLDIAAAIMLRAHRNGKAVVTITTRTEAERVADILREIALKVSVQKI